MDRFPSIQINGKRYCFEHLNPFTTTFTLPAKLNQPSQTYHCIIEFSSHCFTRSFNTRQNETFHNISSELIYRDKKETRIFCPERYELSLRLPGILKTLNQYKCFFTSADDKFLTIELLTEKQEKVQYEIYFSLKKSNKANTDIHIFINSAYPRTTPQNRPKRKPISLFILLYNTLHNRKIKKPL